MGWGDAFNPPKPVRKPRKPKKAGGFGSAFEPVAKPKDKPAPKPGK